MNALVIAPHPDDAELGCGATMARWLDAGALVYVAILTDRDGNLPLAHGSRLDTETLKACQHLAGPENGEKIKALQYQWPIQHLELVRSYILSELESLVAGLRPDIVLAPAGGDLHQDHATARAEALRACKSCSVLEYDILRSSNGFVPNLYVEVTADQLFRKVRAVACYSTQARKAYCSREVIEAAARVHGAKIGCLFAEAFHVCWGLARLDRTLFLI